MLYWPRTGTVGEEGTEKGQAHSKDFGVAGLKKLRTQPNLLGGGSLVFMNPSCSFSQINAELFPSFY